MSTASYRTSPCMRDDWFALSLTRSRRTYVACGGSNVQEWKRSSPPKGIRAPERIAEPTSGTGTELLSFAKPALSERSESNGLRTTIHGVTD